MIREKFYEVVRAKIFNGSMNEPQVQGCEAILDAWDKQELEDKDDRWVAYMLATAFHETAHTMQPIEEYGHGHGHDYGQPDPQTGKAYYGRGYVQLTWKRNYALLGKLLNVDLLNKPELALDPTIAANIMFDGMEHGLFTGKSLHDYFNENTEDWINARRIINGLDRAALIAGYGKTFFAAIDGAKDAADS